MQANIGSLKHNTLLYINIDKTCENNSSSFNNFFNHCLVVDNVENSKRLFKNASEKIDIIILEANDLNNEEIEILDFIRQINSKVPIIFLCNEITNETLVLARQYIIGSFLLRPFKIQELCKLCVGKISKYTNRKEKKNALKILSEQVQYLKEEKKELNKEKINIAKLFNFYSKFHENFLQLVKIDKQGNVKFISQELKKEININILDKAFSHLFEDTKKIQDMLILAMKEKRYIQSLKLNSKNKMGTGR
jgi:response regulator RpfG family c-di-GMP phosphodiesterase